MIMNPKDKAEQLISLEITAQWPSDLVDGIRIFLAKRQAMIFVKVQIKNSCLSDDQESIQYWNEVLKEIENLN